MLGSTSSNVLCSTCASSFETTFHRREHMRGAWHVFNVKRRVESMPPVPLNFYQVEIEGVPSRPGLHEPASGHLVHDKFENQSTPGHPTASGSVLSNGKPASAPASTRSHDEDMSSNPAEIESHCLFCGDTHDSMEASLLHMQTAHGFVVPKPEELATDMATFIAYLALVIETYHACIFCGHEKHSAEAVRAHMLAKGHCQLDLSEASEFLDFWSPDVISSDSVTGTPSTQVIPPTSTEFQLSSGLVISSRQLSLPPVPKRYSNPFGLRRCALVVLPASSHRLSNSCSDLTSSSNREHVTRALARRDEMGIVGLSDSQKRSLAVTQRKAKTTEDRANNKARWTLENMGNKVKQKHFKVGSICRSGLFIDPTMF